MDKIKLNDILNLTEEEISHVKFRFMVPSGEFDPIKTVRNGGDDKKDEVNLIDLVWNGEKIYFREGTIAIGFLPLGEDKWLMTGVVNILHDNGNSGPAVAEYYERLKKYNFRVIVKFHKSFMLGVTYATKEHSFKDADFDEDKKRLIDGLEVLEIWNSEKGLNEKHFPGYHNVLIDYADLKKKLEISDEWKTALKSRNGVYAISDKETGKLYVGSAYGQNGIYGRWKVYVESGYDKDEVENGEYPNKRLQELVQEKGLDYIKKNFQYAILETFTDSISNEDIIKRESFWKEVLLTRKFGYNAN